MGIKEKLPLLNSENKGVRIAGYVIYAFIGLMVLGAILPSPDDGGGTTTTATVESPAAAEPGVLDVAAVRSLLPRAERDRDIRVTDGVVLIYRDSKYNAPSMIMVDGRETSTDIFKQLFGDNRVDEVTVFTRTTFVDKYGQESIGTAAKYQMTRATADKINWDNFHWIRLDEVVDSKYIHPAME